ncbi:unnamed protein product [Amoebophrya sp. A25]|nr:unnamed protein product [Amoebophrya sp. A25]|eukprot:GSA25T00012034001.1
MIKSSGRTRSADFYTSIVLKIVRKMSEHLLQSEDDSDLDFAFVRAYFLANLRKLPKAYSSMDTNRVTLLFFCVAALDLLGYRFDTEERRDIEGFVFSSATTALFPKQRVSRVSCDGSAVAAVVAGDSGVGRVAERARDAERKASKDFTVRGHEGLTTGGLSTASALSSLSLSTTREKEADAASFSIANTFAGLMIIIILSHQEKENDASLVEGPPGPERLATVLRRKVDSLPVRRLLDRAQQSEGSMAGAPCGGEVDMRFAYCAAVLYRLLELDNIREDEGKGSEDTLAGVSRSRSHDEPIKDEEEFRSRQEVGTFNSRKLENAILACWNVFGGGFGMHPRLEAHGGATFCAISALVLLSEGDDDHDREEGDFERTETKDDISKEEHGFLSAYSYIDQHFATPLLNLNDLFCAEASRDCPEGERQLSPRSRKRQKKSHLESLKKQVEGWCLQRQQANGGFQGRVQKATDCCYSFWVGATLTLSGTGIPDAEGGIEFIKSCFCHRSGGFKKYPYHPAPDLLHSWASICGLSLCGHPAVGKVDARFGVRAFSEAFEA